MTFYLENGTPKKHAKYNPGPPWSSGMTYYFVGTNTSTGDSRAFTVLAGAGGPNPSAGFAKIQINDRPRRVGFTMPVGWDPLQLDIPIQFEGMNSNWSLAGSGGIEGDIQILEWMSGRGKIAGYDAKLGAPTYGDPPTVRVSSLDSKGQPTNLIAPNYHGMSWYVSNLAYDTSPIRNRNGDRIRQLVTVSLTQKISLPTTTSKPKPPTYSLLRTSSADNTLRKTVKATFHDATNADLSAALTMTQSHKRSGTPCPSRLDQTLPVGTPIYVPLNSSGTISSTG